MDVSFLLGKETPARLQLLCWRIYSTGMKGFSAFSQCDRGTPYYQRSGGNRRRYESQWDYVALNPEGMKKKPQISHLQIICLTVQKLTEKYMQ